MKSRCILSVFAASALLAGNVHAQAKPKALPDTVMVEEDGGIVLKTLPEKLTVKDDRPNLVRMGEWVAAYFALPVKTGEVGRLAAQVGAAFENDDWNKSGYEFAYKLFKKEAKVFGFRIEEIYTLNASSYSKLIKDYNRLAKREGQAEIEIRPNSQSWSGGLRCELEAADVEILIKSMSSNRFKGKLPVLVQREIEQGRPVPWARIYYFEYDEDEEEAMAVEGGPAKEGEAVKEGKPAKAVVVPEESYGAVVYIIIGLNLKTRELYYVDPARKPNQRQTMSFDRAAATTWAIYKLTPPATRK